MIAQRIVFGVGIGLCVGCAGAKSDSGGGSTCPASVDVASLPALSPDIRLPFPGPDIVQEGHLHLPANLPHAATPFPSDSLSWRTGLSPVQTWVVPPPASGAWIDPATLSAYDEARFDGSVRIVDLVDGTFLPVFAELDANEPEGRGALLVRPLKPATQGHQVAYVITRDVRLTDGEPVAFPWYDDALAGQPSKSTASVALNGCALEHRLAELGIDDVALALSWPVDDGRRQLEQMVEATPVPSSCTLVKVADADEGTNLPHTYQQYAGSFETADWVGDDGVFRLDADGKVEREGLTDADIFVHIPASVRDAEGPVPVWLFGHGIFGSPEVYLADLSDPSALLEVADRAGAVVVATSWRGLSRADLTGVALGVAADIGTFPALTHRLSQALTNASALLNLVRNGGLSEVCGLAQAVDPSKLRYYGISLGAIEGATLLALDGGRVPGVLHVGGSTWSTMLERSSNWTSFQPLVIRSGLDRPVDRQILYAASQLLWDPVDPAVWTDQLVEAPLLWQISRGDDQVPNLTTWTLARGVGAPLILPSPEQPAGVTALEASGLEAPAFALFDPALGDHESDNLPSPKTRAHDTPRHWEMTKRQLLTFLDPEQPGHIVAACGADPCTEATANP